MRKITKKQFLSDVMHEIEMLKEHATSVEKTKLNFNSFRPAYPCDCIYGQLTGYCGSQRAKELMDNCCIRQMHLENAVADVENSSFIDIKNMINGAYNGQTWDHERRRRYNYISVLEAFINLKDAKNAEIISYIKGETATLTL